MLLKELLERRNIVAVQVAQGREGGGNRCHAGQRGDAAGQEPATGHPVGLSAAVRVPRQVRRAGARPIVAHVHNSRTLLQHVLRAVYPRIRAIYSRMAENSQRIVLARVIANLLRTHA